MLNYLVLGLTALSLASQNIFKQRFNKLKMDGGIFFAAMICFFAALFFSIVATVQGEWQFSSAILPYSGGFALSYACSTLFVVLAIMNGSLAATSLVVNFSLLLPTVFCIIVFDEPVTFTLILGTILLIVSLLLVNLPAKNQPQKITLKWFVFALLAFLGNGACSIVQKLENQNVGAEGARVFMTLALLIAGVILSVVYFVSQKRKDTVSDASAVAIRQDLSSHASADPREAAPNVVQAQLLIKRSFPYALGAGFANGLTNFLVMYLNLHKMNGSIMFPVISAGSMLIIFLWSTFILKERFSLRQYIGYAFGLAAIVILNI